MTDGGDESHWLLSSSSILLYLATNGFPQVDTLICLLVNMFHDGQRWDADVELQELHTFYLPFLRKVIDFRVRDFRHATLTFRRKPRAALDDYEHVLHQWLRVKLHCRLGFEIERPLATVIGSTSNIRRLLELYP